MELAAQATYLDTLRKRKRPRELAESALAHGVALLVALARYRGLARDAQDVVLDIQLDILLREAGEFERGRHKVLLLVLVQIQSANEDSERTAGEGRGGGNYIPWTHGTRNGVGILVWRTRDSRRRQPESASIECLVKEAIEVGKRVERLGEQCEGRHIESCKVVNGRVVAEGAKGGK